MLMRRMDAYNLGSYKQRFISLLRENGFEYNTLLSTVTCPGLKEPEIAVIMEGRSPHLMISGDSPTDVIAKNDARRKLRDLADKF